MSGERLRNHLRDIAAENRAALVVYLTQGDIGYEAGVDLLCAVADAGADVIELGVPFSDPSADGTVIQGAMQRSLQRGGGMSAALDTVTDFRQRGYTCPLVLFGYYNPIFVMGIDDFALAAERVGVDGVLTVDVPLEEVAELNVPLASRGIGVVPLVAPTSTRDRVEAIAKLNPGFVYYLSKTGVTGSTFQGTAGGAQRVDAIRQSTRSPVCIGFGIKTPAEVHEVAQIADGVVIGSAVVQRVHNGTDEKDSIARVAQFVAQLRAAVVR